ncbi:hypothetical protein UPYG_G00284770 [Umbra pygmaea]|uniref:FYN-binding protein 1 n=1 Tax=Umbra pygmaea TaxID=75934 RepID=A0ABD0WN58_UMBPY
MQDNKSDVKAIMARFSSEGNATEGTTPGRPKAALHPTLSSGAPINQKKPALETSLSGSIATPQKPNYLKNTVPNKSVPDVRELTKTKPITSRFQINQEDSKPSFLKPTNFKTKPEVSQDAEVKSFPPKPLQKPSLCSTMSDPKPVTAKPAIAVAKPSWVKDPSPNLDESRCNPNSLPPKFSSPLKPVSSFTKMRLKSEDSEVGAVESASKTLSPGTSPKPSNFRTAQNAFNKADTQSEERVKETSKVTSTDSGPPKPPATKKPSFKKPPGTTFSALGGGHLALTSSSSTPKKNPLPNTLALGSPPAKPNRPPRVNLEMFKKATEANTDNVFRKGSVPPPPASHPSTHVAPPLPPQPMAPSLPPRPTPGIIQPETDENYDDVEFTSRPPEDSESGEEMYEDLDERWGPVESKEQEKKREREEKKRQEVEKKEQKERERKEQEARKKFKLTGPLKILHKVKARGDSKGSKTDLLYKQGECIDIIRVVDNPEGRWLGRSLDGCYGYVKTDAVEIDFDTLKRQGLSVSNQMEHEPDVYDDVDFNENHKSDNRGPGVFLPPPPGDDGELYDDLDNPSFNSSLGPLDPRSPPKPRGLSWVFKGIEEWRKNPSSKIEVPPPSQFNQEGNTEASADEIYDDVDVNHPVSSPSQSKTKNKSEEKDSKKQKKFEKEEKEFRKKFKYDGEIQVLYQVTVISNIANKKWGNKDLPLKPGETVDVIVKAVDNKLICRNEEGKFGHVLTSHIVAEDADIYDDIGDDSIYDND